MSNLQERRLPFVLTPEVRSIQISAGTRCSIAGAQLPPDMWAELPVQRPQILFGYVSDYKRLLESVHRRMYNPESVDHAVIVLIQHGDAPLTDGVRDDLWRGFRVPVYQVFLSPTGTLLAWECEMREGLHLEPGLSVVSGSSELLFESRKRERFQTGLGARIETDPCQCGRKSPRLVDLASIKRSLKRRLLSPAA